MKNMIAKNNTVNIPPLANWTYHFEEGTLLLSDEIYSIFEIEKSSKQTCNKRQVAFDILLKHIITEDNEKVNQVHQTMIDGKEEYTLEYSILTNLKNKKKLYEICKIIQEKNIPKMAIGTIFDISALDRLEKKSKNFKEQFSEIFEGNLDGLFIVKSKQTEDYKIDRVNASFEKILNTPRNEIIHQDLKKVFPNGNGQKIIAHIKRTIRENEIVRLDIQLKNKKIIITLLPIRTQEENISQVMGIVVDVTEKEVLNNEINRNTWASATIEKVIKVISRTSTEKELIQDVSKNIADGNEFYPICCSLEVLYKNKISLKMQHYIGEKGIIFNDYIHDGKFMGEECILKSISSKKVEAQNLEPSNNIKSILALPIAWSGKVNLVFVVYSNQFDAFSGKIKFHFQMLSEVIKISFERLQAQAAYQNELIIKEHQNNRMQATIQNTIYALGTMLEYRDLYTAGHQKKVADLAAAIAKEMGLPSERIYWLYHGAILHDIGKINIPSEILNKPDKLTSAEFSLIKTHPEVGYQILKDIEFAGPVADIVRQHHEYLDGSGYPFGLKSDEIMLESKILTVADIVEAMLSHRSYRPATSQEYILNEIIKMKGIKLDPEVVDICCQLFEQKFYHFPDNRTNYSSNLSDSSYLFRY